MHIITQTPRIVIREFLPGEMETYLNHFNDAEVCLYIPKRTRDERIAIFHAALHLYATTKRSGTWGMFGKADGAFIGSCLLRPFDNVPQTIEIGYSMDRIYWGQGIATEMARAMVAYAFADKNVKEVVGCTVFENISSQRVLEKAGLKRVENLVRGGQELAFYKIAAPFLSEV